MKRLISRKRKTSGFSLVELVVVILIIAVLAVAVFVGGSSAIGKSRVRVVESDFHNYEVAAKSYMTEHSDMLRLNLTSDRDEYKSVAFGLNEYLGTEYTINTEKPVPSTGSVCNSNSSIIAFETIKKDPYGNPYVVIFDPNARNIGDSEYYITIVSAGTNGKCDVGSALDDDDEFLLCQYCNGDVVTASYFMETDSFDYSGHQLKAGFTKLSSASGAAPANTMTPTMLTQDEPAISDEEIGQSSSATKVPSDSGCRHSFVSEIIESATATKDGLMKYTCTLCNGYYTTPIKVSSSSKYDYQSGNGFVSIENGIDYDVPSVKFYGTCQQYGTPTPDNPIPVTCNNAVWHLCGKNLFNDAILAEWGCKKNGNIWVVPDSNLLYHKYFYTNSNNDKRRVAIQYKINCFGENSPFYLNVHYTGTTIYDVRRNDTTELTFVSGVTAIDKTINFIRGSYGSRGYNFQIAELQLEYGSVATAFEPYYDGGTVDLSQLPDGGLYAVGNARDEWDAATGNGVRRCGVINSYTGEDVGDNWLSSTGALTTGATVVYELQEPVFFTAAPQPISEKAGYNQLLQVGGDIANTPVSVSFVSYS